MALDVELYRRTLFASGSHEGAQRLRRTSVIDIHPDGAKRTVVFVHGYGGRNLQWLYQLRSFGQTMRVIAPDLRGHGQSDDADDPPHSMASLVDDLETTLDALGVTDPFLLVAHSFGGAIATEYALRHPERVTGMVLIGVPTRFILQPGVRPLMSLPSPIIGDLVKRLGIALYAPLRTLRQMCDGAMAPWRGAERLPLLQTPTLVVLGQRDTVFSQEHYAAAPRMIPGAQQVVIPVAAHLVQLERPDAVNRAIRRFIEARTRVEVAVGAHGATVGGAQAGASGPALNDAQSSSPGALSGAAARLVEMPWLQYYDTDVPEQMPVPRGLAHDLLIGAAHEFPDRTALYFFGQRISFRELDLLSNRFAHALRGLGVQPGDRVAVVLPNTPQCVIAFYGTLKAGAVVVLGSPLSTPEEIAAQLRDADAKALLTLSSYREALSHATIGGAVEHLIFTDVREYLPLRQRLALATLLGGNRTAAPTAQPAPASSAGVVASSLPAHSPQLHELQPLLRSQSSAPLQTSTVSSDLALIQYTSGTTDTPKGVMLSHENLVVNVAQNRHWTADAKRGAEIILGVLPLSHSYGVTGCLNLAMSIAASLVLLPTSRTDQILDAIKRHHPTIFPGVPSIYLAVANYPKVRSYGVASIRICVSGSAPLPVEAQEAFEKLTRGRLVEGYGLTEASPVTHSNPLKGERRVGSIGIPLPSTRARVVNWETGAPLAAGEVGELLVQGPQVMMGYWKRPDETAQALVDGWLRTGDLARMDEDGFFTIVDRKKDLILAGPYNVYPRDVEEVLYEHPKVLEAVVVSAQSPAGGAESGEASEAQNPFIKAVVVLKRGERATADELLALCRERLESYKVPRQIEFRTELPKNLVGKVLRRLLVEG